MGNPLPLCTLATEALAKQCYQALQGNFNPIARLTVESVLQERAGEITPVPGDNNCSAWLPPPGMSIDEHLYLKVEPGWFVWK